MTSMSFDDAAHLLRRMGFGGSPEEIENIAAKGREAAVDHLMNFREIDNRAMDDLLDRSFDFANPFDPERFNPGEIRRWWFTRMVHSRRQFEEKLTLFWHNFFATANSKVPEILMLVQNQTLRANGLARFDDLLLKVAQDPAMLVWLDGLTNVLGSPNENFARELQELFSMGITDVVTGEPNYTEQDVKEIARAFTGWKFRPPRGLPDPFTFPFFVNPVEHDNGPKTIFGQIANFSGADVITVIAARRATARFVVKKIFDFFVYPMTAGLQDTATLEKLADVYIANNHSLAALFRAVFLSDEFFSERARFALVKSPVELIAGSIRMLGATYNPGPPRRSENGNILFILSALMGQDIFNPPDVSGWGLNLGWVNTAALLLRYNYADILTVNRPQNPEESGLFITHQQLRRLAKASPKKTVKRLLSILGPLSVSAETFAALRDYLTTDDNGNRAEFALDDLSIDKKVRGLIHLVLCLPVFQMN